MSVPPLRTTHLAACLVLLGLVWGGCRTDADPNDASSADTTAETVAVEQAFGAEVDVNDSMSASDLAARASDWEGRDVTVRGRIGEVCQKKGCWLALDAGEGRPIRVLVPRTEDGYGFTVPTGASGEAVVHGTLSIQPLDTATRDHYESDGAARPDSVEVQIAARGIQIFPKG